MDPDPHPLLLGDDIRDAAVESARRPEYLVPVLEEALQGGGGGGDAKDAARVRTPDPLHPGIADAPSVKARLIVDVTFATLLWCSLVHSLYSSSKLRWPIVG